MEINNLLAKFIETAGIKAAYDEACKRVLANKQILAWIVKSCIEEFQNYTIQDIAERYIEGTPKVAEVAVHQDTCGEFIEGNNTEDTSMTEGTIYYDIRFYVILPATLKLTKIIMNIESQNKFYPGYPLVKRGIYYGSRMISAQYGTEFEGTHYEDIKKVYSIWICQNPPKYRSNSIVKYSFAENVLVGQSREKIENYDLITVVMICLGGAEYENYQDIIKLLDVLFSSELEAQEKKRILQEEFGIAMTRKIEREVSGMCNLSEGVFEKAWDKAWGEAWGEAVSETTLQAICNLMENTGWTVERCMDVLKVAEEEKIVYKQKIEEKNKDL